MEQVQNGVDRLCRPRSTGWRRCAGRARRCRACGRASSSWRRRSSELEKDDPAAGEPLKRAAIDPPVTGRQRRRNHNDRSTEHRIRLSEQAAQRRPQSLAGRASAPSPRSRRAGASCSTAWSSAAVPSRRSRGRPWRRPATRRQETVRELSKLVQDTVEFESRACSSGSA